MNPRRRGPNAYVAFALPALLLVGLLYILPLAWLAYASIGGPGELTDKWYAQIANSANIHKIIWTTVRVVGITSVLALALGYVTAYAMLRLPPRSRMLLALCVLMPFWLSVLVRAFAWLILLRNNGLVNTALMDAGLVDAPLELVRNELGVIIGMVHYMIPYAVFPLYASMCSVDAMLVMAARCAGASPRRAFVDVFLPLTAPATFGVWLLVFVFGLGFFVTPAILGGGKIIMLSEYATLTVLQSARWGLAGALSMVLLASTLTLIWLVSRAVNLRRLLGSSG